MGEIMEQQTIHEHFIKATEVLEEIFALEPALPKEEELTALLRERKLSPLRVAEPSGVDFEADDLEAFLKYLRVNSIKTVMYRLCFYTDKDMDNEYTLSDAEKKFFQKHIRQPEPYLDEDGEYRMPDPPYDQPYEESDLVCYKDYCKYLRLAMDLTAPKELWLYALHQGKCIACRMEDEWLTRLTLPNAQTIKQECVNFRNYGGYKEGGIAFRFDYDIYAGEEADEDEGYDETDAAEDDE